MFSFILFCVFVEKNGKKISVGGHFMQKIFVSWRNVSQMVALKVKVQFICMLRTLTVPSSGNFP